MEIVPIKKCDAYAFAEKMQNYPIKFHKPLLALACAEWDVTIGVAVLTLPQSWAHNDGWTIEVQTFADTADVDKVLTVAAWKAARAIGYSRMIGLDERMTYADGYVPHKPLPKPIRQMQMGRKVRWDSAMGGRANG